MINIHIIFVVESFTTLLKLEAKYGTPSHYISTVSQLVDYYKQVHTYVSWNMCKIALGIYETT